MKSIPRAVPWETTLAELKQQLHRLDGAERTAMEKKVVALERAIGIRDSLSSAATPHGKMSLSI